MAKLVIEIETDDDATGLVAKFSKDTTANYVAIRELINLMEGMASGTYNGAMNVKLGAVQASKTGTFTGNPTAADTVTVNGVAFTARASGAVANEYNIGADATANAAALAASINASVTAGIVDVVLASSALGVITFKSKQAGKVGNSIVLSESTGNFTLAGTVLAGGTQSTNKTYLFGKAATTAY
jgi:phage tail sheath gpL-like